MLLILIIASLVVAGEGFAEYSLPNVTLGGFLNSKTAFKYSVLTKEIECKYQEKFKAIYDVLWLAKAPVPEILGVSQINNKSGFCNIFYRNTLKLDAKVENVNQKIEDTLTELNKIMEKNRMAFLFHFHHSMFMYDGEKDKFLFKNLDNIAQVTESYPNPTSEKHNQIVKTFRNLDYSKVLDKISNLDHQHDDYKLVDTQSSGKPGFQEVPADKQSAKDAANVLKIGVDKEGDNWKVTSTLGLNADTLLFSSANELFSLYFCQKIGENSNECISLEQVGFELSSWNFKIKENHKINIEIRRVNSIDEYLNKLYFKVFLTPIDINTIRVSPTHSYLREEIEKKTDEKEKKLSYLFNDKGVDGLIISVLNSKEEKPITIPLNSKIEFEEGIEIYQISLDYFEFKRSDLFHYNKNYQVRVPNEKIIIISEEENGQPVKIRLVDKKPEFNFSFFKGCKSDVLIYDLDGPNATFRLKYKDTEKIFPKKFVIEGTKEKEEPLKCFDIRTDKKHKFSRYSVVPDGKVFYWNFNSHSKAGTIQFFDKSITNDINFLFGNFVNPSNEAFTLYLSISVKDDGNLDVRIIYYNEKKVKVEVPRENLYLKLTKEIPRELSYFDERAAVKAEAHTFPFKELDVTYLSNKEIVYSVKIPGIKMCIYTLAVFFHKSTSHFIKCDNKNADHKDLVKTSDFNAATHIPGFKKVLQEADKLKILRII